MPFLFSNYPLPIYINTFVFQWTFKTNHGLACCDFFLCRALASAGGGNGGDFFYNYYFYLDSVTGILLSLGLT